MSRQKGLELVKEYEGKIPRKFLDDFLHDAELTYDEFLKVCEKFTNEDLFKKDNDGKLIRDGNNNLEKINYDNIT